MKAIYWRPKKVSRTGLLMVMILAILGLSVVHLLPVKQHPTLTNRTWDAANLAQAMLAALKDESQSRGHRIDPRLDPTLSGMIGVHQTAVTSRLGDLAAKQTSVNPNFAAAVVQMLWEAEVRPGDTVAVGWSGSFPAWNVAVAAAVDALDLKPVIIASATASQFGANRADFMWLDMESTLRDRGLTECRSLAVSPGAGRDNGRGLPEAAHDAIQAAAHRNAIPLLKEKSLRRSINRRIETYATAAEGKAIRAYINVGGGVASTGGEFADHQFRPGLNLAKAETPVGAPVDATVAEQPPVDCVMLRMAEAGIPVVHLRHAKRLANQWALPIAPLELQDIGAGRAFHAHTPNRWLALSVVLILLSTLQLAVLKPGAHWLAGWAARHGIRFRFGRTPATHAERKPQLMV